MTNEASDDTWHARELPVLREIARLLEDGAWRVHVETLTNDLDLPRDQIERASKLLERDGYVDFPPRASRRAGGVEVQAITGKGLRAVGQWPNEETALDRIIEALEAIAEGSDDADTRTNAQKFAAWLRGSATTVGLSVASAAITGQIPGA